MPTPTKESIHKILSQNKKPMHVSEIAQKIIDSGATTSLTKEDLAKKISSKLSQDVRKKSKAMFRKISNKKGGHKKGIYGIKKKKITSEEKSIKKWEKKLKAEKKQTVYLPARPVSMQY